MRKFFKDWSDAALDEIIDYVEANPAISMLFVVMGIVIFGWMLALAFGERIQ